MPHPSEIVNVLQWCSSRYNISISDVEETFKWLCAQNHVAMPEQLSTMTVNFVLSDLIAESTPKKKEPVSGRILGMWDSGFRDVFGLGLAVWSLVLGEKRHLERLHVCSPCT